jgi:hypothetical protein
MIEPARVIKLPVWSWKLRGLYDLIFLLTFHEPVATRLSGRCGGTRTLLMCSGPSRRERG